jgi:hypothetical protein
MPPPSHAAREAMVQEFIGMYAARGHEVALQYARGGEAMPLLLADLRATGGAVVGGMMVLHRGGLPAGTFFTNFKAKNCPLATVPAGKTLASPR